MDKNDLPEPVNLRTFIINRNKQKFCDCYDWISRMKGRRPQYEIDTTNRVVTCKHCGVFVDPFEALIAIANDYEELMEEEHRLFESIKELSKYKPWKRSIKKIEQGIGRKGEMVPCCPKCGEPFRLEQIEEYINENIIPNKGWIKNESYR